MCRGAALCLPLVLEPSAVAKKQIIRELREMCAEGLPE